MIGYGRNGDTRGKICQRLLLQQETLKKSKPSNGMPIVHTGYYKKYISMFADLLKIILKIFCFLEHPVCAVLYVSGISNGFKII